MPVIVLDTNVISELMRPQPDQGVLAWANSLDPEGAAITAMNEAEILHGLARLPDGRRKVQRSSCGRQGQGEHRAVTLTPWLRGVEGGVSSPMRHGSHHQRSLPVPPVTPEHAPALSSRAGRPSARVVLTAGSAAKRQLLGSDLPRNGLGGAFALGRLTNVSTAQVHRGQSRPLLGRIEPLPFPLPLPSPPGSPPPPPPVPESRGPCCGC